MTAGACDFDLERDEPAMANTDLQVGRLADDGSFETVAMSSLHERTKHDTAELFVAREKDPSVLRLSAGKRTEDCGDRAFRVGRAERVQPSVVNARDERIARPIRVRRHRVDVRIDEKLRPAEARIYV